MGFKLVDRVTVIDYNKHWDDYKDTVGRSGTIMGKISSNGNYPVRIDSLVNKKSSYRQGCFWVKEEYLELLSDSESALGRRVRITSSKRKESYKKTQDAVGTIAFEGRNEYGILLDNFKNPRSSKGLYWYTIDEFVLLPVEEIEKVE